MSRFVTVLPSARKLMASLRDIGYDLPSAVADLVDNSMDAGAENVEVTFVDDGARSWIRIADDGMGMSAGELDEAMRYGSQRSYSSSALGHFGLGLKTGSLSQCRRLTVASRRRRNARIVARRWDLDLVAERDSWDLESPPKSELPPHLLEPLEGGTGTVVLWENLDRILAFRNPDGAATRRALESMASEVSAHLGMVFHRFITGEWADGEAFVNIAVNGSPVTAWDPFAREEPETTVLPAQAIELTHEEGSTAKLAVQPYVLPAQTRFSSPEAKRSSGHSTFVARCIDRFRSLLLTKLTEHRRPRHVCRGRLEREHVQERSQPGHPVGTARRTRRPLSRPRHTRACAGSARSGVNGPGGPLPSAALTPTA